MALKAPSTTTLSRHVAPTTVVLRPLRRAQLCRKRASQRCIAQAAVATSTDTRVEPQQINFPARAPQTRKTVQERHGEIVKHFPKAYSLDDFIARVEIALGQFGFTAENSIAVTNLCRDEVTAVLKDKIEAVFGSSFNVNGLGGVLTCGVTGFGAGFSHSPVCQSQGKERYIFFSFPHIAIDSDGVVGSIYRPGRPGKSCACGAMAKCLSELQSQGIVGNCKVPGLHEFNDPEYSILKQRLARRIRMEQLDVNTLDMVSLTQIAERTITSDMELLIENTVDPGKADYAVVTGVQIHNWAVEGTGEAHMEFVSLGKLYVSIDGKPQEIALDELPVLPPRLISLAAGVSEGRLKREAHGRASQRSEAGKRSSTLAAVTSAELGKRLGATFLDSASVQALPSNSAILQQAWQALAISVPSKRSLVFQDPPIETSLAPTPTQALLTHESEAPVVVAAASVQTAAVPEPARVEEPAVVVEEVSAVPEAVHAPAPTPTPTAAGAAQPVGLLGFLEKLFKS